MTIATHEGSFRERLREISMFFNKDDTRVLNLPALTELKLAARRYKDFGDVVELVRVHNLDESFSAKLHPSVHADFIECLEEKRRDDEYETRQDQTFERQCGSDSTPRA